MLVTDKSEEDSALFQQQAEAMLKVLSQSGQRLDWEVISQDDFSQVHHLLEQIESRSADLIVTYRNLYLPASEHPYSLGVFVDVLTQAAAAPVLLLPRPENVQPAGEPLQGTARVMAITDHLAGDNHLVSYAAEFVETDGTLFLTHVEDEQTFQRYVRTIGKIPSIDTDEARAAILEQLLKEPTDYISSCRQVLQAEKPSLSVEKIVTVGHHLSDYKRLASDHQIDLLVMNTKDEDQASHARRGLSTVG